MFNLYWFSFSSNLLVGWLALRLCVFGILQGKFEEVFTSWGIVCSSWVVASRGSTGRSFICPMGNPDFEKVALSNRMASRIAGFFNRNKVCSASIPHHAIPCHALVLL